MQMVIFTGAQASGKSTFYKYYFYDTHVRINLDMLKTRHRESILFSACLESKANCVIDNTNPKKHDRLRYILPAKRKGFSIIGYFFKSAIEDALKRNEKRKNPIPEKGIYATFNKLEEPSLDEGFDILYCVSIDTQNNFVVNKM